MTFQFIADHADQWPVRWMCEALDVSASGYHAWEHREPSEAQNRRDQLVAHSMSGVAQCWDNAPVESFFAGLKRELVHDEKYTTREQAKASIFEYLEVFYNRVRIHSSLGVRLPGSV